MKIVLNGVRSARSGIPNLNEETTMALARAAHARGMLAVAHVESLPDVGLALASGMDGRAHLWREEGPDADIIRRIVAQRMFVVPTLVIPDGLVPGPGAALAADPRLRSFLAPAVLERLTRPPAGVVLRGDPTVDVTATRDIVRVWRSGVELDRRLGRR